MDCEVFVNSHLNDINENSRLARLQRTFLPKNHTNSYLGGGNIRAFFGHWALFPW